MYPQMWWWILGNVSKIEIKSDNGLLMSLSISKDLRIKVALQTNFIYMLSRIFCYLQSMDKRSGCVFIHQKGPAIFG